MSYFIIILIVQIFEPQIFAPGTLSTSQVETSVAIAPNEQLAYVSRHSGSWGSNNNPPSKIYRYIKTKHTWQLQGLASMSDSSSKDSDYDIFISYDGKEAFFVSTRTYPEKSDNNPDIWKCIMYKGFCTNPQPVHAVNSTGYEASPVTDNSGNLYFSSIRKDGIGAGDLYVAFRNADGSYQPPELLKGKINGPSGEWNLLVAPEADWIIFESSGRIEGLSAYGDLYFSTMTQTEWSEPTHLSRLNTSGSDLNPRFLPKSKQLIFISSEKLENTETNIFKIDQPELLLP